MPYTLGDLIAELQPILWPDGEAENLVGPHRAMMVEALYDIQQVVPCYQINNTQIVPQCNTYFNCGYTVTDAPRGHIQRVYTIDKINQTTGQEDASVPVDWCSEVDYLQVQFNDLDRYVSTTLANALDSGFYGWWAGLLNGAPLGSFIAFPALANCWGTKYSFPPPTDAGLATAPPLPLGFHYAQSSTDNPAGRAQYGLWALKGGQIYIAPWIQSTETIVIEWDGLKRTWTDFDIVDDNPQLKRAVQAYVEWKHARVYDHDFEAAQTAEADYNLAVAWLMRECQEENAIRSGASGNDQSSSARGASTVVPTYVNDQQQAAATCPNGSTGNPVTVTVPAGSVVSLTSVADANAKAQSQALQQAGAQLQCTVNPPSWVNMAQSFTANCGTGTGTPVTITIASGTITSLVSQSDANAQALLQAAQQAQSQIKCTYINTAQTYTGACADHSNSTTVTTPAGQYTSTVSQAQADSLALAAATNSVNATLSGLCSTGIFWNIQRTVGPITYGCQSRCGYRLLSATVTVNAHQFSSLISQADANNQADQYGVNGINNQLQGECALINAECQQ